MPELPEVETIRRNLLEILKDDVITEVIVHYRPIVSNDINFEEKLCNQKINDIQREGKYLKFILNDYMLISHLRMEGKYFMDYEKDKHTHVEFILKSNHKLSYHDTRKFGRFELVDIKEANIYLNKKKSLQKDPKDIDFRVFFEGVKSKNKTIKEILLDQSVIGGIGNIYANEILYLSKMNPAKKGFMVKEEEARELLNNSNIVLDKAILMGGSSIDTFESLGHKGMFQQELNVHGKQNEPCKRCGSLIKKVQLKGRGTYFCPVCQKSHVIALTGGIASGKSTASSYLIKKGFQVIDADQIVKDLYNDEEISLFIAKKFNALTNDKLDRVKLGNIIFSDEKKRKQLEKILHPLVFQKIDFEISNSLEYLIFIDIPLLFETKYSKYDESLLIYLDQENQIDRLMKRNNLSKEEALLRIKSQMSLEKKKKLANYVINNKGTISMLYEAIDKYLEKY